VKVICIIHFLFCIFFIATSSAILAVKVAGAKLSTEVQTFNAGWSCLGIVVIVLAFLGTDYSVDTHTPYLIYLVGCLIGCVVWFAVFITSYEGCFSIPSAAGGGSSMPSFFCGISHSLFFLWLLVVVVCTLGAINMVWQVKKNIDTRDKEALLEEAENISEQMTKLNPFAPKPRM